MKFLSARCKLQTERNDGDDYVNSGREEEFDGNEVSRWKLSF